jgi:hypothetical protein
VFRSPLEIEVLAQAHRDDLQPHRSVSASAAGSVAANGPLRRTRRAMGHGLIALGERLADRPAHAPLSTLPLRPADGRTR